VRVCTRVHARVRECGRVQRKTNKAYRIDRRNPEHVRSLSLSLCILPLLADVPVLPSKTSPVSYVLPVCGTCAFQPRARLEKCGLVRAVNLRLSLCFVRADGLSQQSETLD